MSATTGFRIAAVVLVLFAVLHTIGFLSFKPPTTEGMAVRDGMMNVHFQVKGSDFSYGNFYRGFGLSITASGLFAALVAWYLAKHTAPPIGWGLCGLQIVGLILSVMYFAIPPAVFSAVLAALLGWSTWKSQMALK